MKLLLDLLFVLGLGYLIFRFIQVLIKMKQEIVFPQSEADLLLIRKQPELPFNSPTYTGQKSGIIIYSIVLSFVTIIFLITIFIQSLNLSIYLLLFLLMAQNSNFTHLFVILEDGILSDNRFVAWGKMKSFKFVSIDGHHRFYGYEKEVNNTYELKIKTTFTSISCIVMSVEAKEKLDRILTENIAEEV